MARVGGDRALRESEQGSENAPVCVHDYNLHGTPVRVRCADAGISEHVGRLLLDHGFDRGVGNGGRQALAVELRSEPGASSPRARGSEVAGHLGISVQRSAGGLVVDDGRSRLELHPDSGTLQGLVDPALSSYPVRSRRNLIILYSVMTLLRYRGLFGLHAAAISWNEVGCLLVARSGGGKSTAALNLVRAGWSLVSDDSVVLCRGEDAVTAWALRRDLLLKCSDSQVPGAEQWERLAFPDRDLFRLRVADAYPEQCRPACTPRLLLFPAVGGCRRSEIESIDKGDALFELLEQSTVADLEPSQTPAQVAVLTSLVNQCTSFQLIGGTDILTEPAAFSSRLKELVRSTLPRGTSGTGDGRHGVI